jgi:pyridoxine kinase
LPPRAIMPKILSFSSQVAYGHVGHSVGVFAWQRLGIDVIALPTVILANRPDYRRVAGLRVEPAQIEQMLESLEENGLLDALDAVFTGYMPSAEHALMIADWLRGLRDERPDIRVMCDPILGDDPGGLYIPQRAAEVLRDRLLPLADIIKPNRFELGWLTGTAVDSLEATIEAGLNLAPMVLVTSGAEPLGKLTNLLLCRDDGGWLTEVTRREAVPHGSGDLMAALFLGHVVKGRTAAEALALATAGVEAVVEESLGADELRLVQTQDAWASPAPWPLEQVELFL